MDKKSTTWGVSPDKIAHLFETCSDTSQTDQNVTLDEKKAILLQDWLAQTFSSAPSPSRELSRNQSKLTNTIWALASKPIGELLEDTKTEIALIRKIKDYGKKLSKHAKSEFEHHHVANTIYYAAIAHGLVFSNSRITRFSYKELRQSFCRLSKEGWIPKGLLGLFMKASEYCETKEQ
jgi:hypothetical protein